MITDFTKEHPDRTLWRFWIPMMFSVMFQQIYNIADSMIAGKFAGEDALAAVGASYPITIIFMAFAVGMNLGSSVVVSRLFGAGDRKGVKCAVTTAFVSSLGLAAVLTVFGYFFSSNMMEWIHTPQNIMADGILYLKIYVFGMVFLMLYNVCTGVFTALGDSKTPLYFLLGSSAGNIILDLIFVAQFHWGVAGVAWATFIAQGISAVLALLTLFSRLRSFAGEEKQPFFDRGYFTQIFAIAVPSILQQSVLSVGNLFVQDIVNRYGSAVVAGYSGAIKLNIFAINIFMTLGSCLSSYTAQNIGAGKAERIPLGFRTGLKLSAVGSCSVYCSVCWPQQTYDGVVSECREWSCYYCGDGVSSDSSTLVSYDCNKTDDRWNYQRCRCNDVFCSCNCTRSDYQNFICNDVQQKFWKHWNLDGMAIWLDCSYSADVDFL